MNPLAWGAKVSPEFKSKVISTAAQLGIDPDWLMSCIAFESGETFSPSVKNAAGSGAVGLIQFMPQTAALLGTSTEDLAGMTAEKQLDYVARYFRHWAGKVKSLADLYMVILWPAAVGQPDYYVLFDRDDPNHPKRYLQNRGLDFNGDGKIVKQEAAAGVMEKLVKGRRPEFLA
jgi:Transglycosylase SLT domain